MGRSSIPSAWCSNTLRMRICDKTTEDLGFAAALRDEMLRAYFEEHDFALQNVEACFAVESFRGFVVLQYLNFDGTDAAFAAEIFNFVKCERADAAVAG